MNLYQIELFLLDAALAFFCLLFTFSSFPNLDQIQFSQFFSLLSSVDLRNKNSLFKESSTWSGKSDWSLMCEVIFSEILEILSATAVKVMIHSPSWGLCEEAE